MSHSKSVCEYGYTHTQCRCMSEHKTIIRIKCGILAHRDNPKKELVATVLFDGPHVESEVKDEIQVFDAPEDSTPSLLTLNERFDAVLQRYLWWMTDEARHTIRDTMTTEVLNWMKD